MNYNAMPTIVDSSAVIGETGAPIVSLILDNGETVIRDLSKLKTLLGDGDGNTKLRKNRKRGFLTRGLSLSPHTTSAIGNVCPHASAGCIESCLDHSGRGWFFWDIHVSRAVRTVAWYTARPWFKSRLIREIESARKTASAGGFDLCARLNVFSDIPWEKQFPELFEMFADVEFYDYSKNPKRYGALRSNYWVTFSRAETTASNNHALRILRACGNVAVVFHGGLPRKWHGFDVIDGDESDLRFLDSRGRKRGRVVGLKLKTGSADETAKALASGFAVDTTAL